eukprot:TRINITY_DN17264_c0_g1_i3.p1 TRINITY_DN17264_c0_g1~~TRINITY_DN17264_c0_g1_i3.p1  ORF type:complete len:584 (+),score=150.03 TRINITY_DN17264_c0_g1_i3:187-1752(+)
MDDSGFFSVQVISKALSVWGLELIPYESSDTLATRARQSPLAANAYICNYREHWFTIRRLGTQWFNLNSLLEFPELVSNTYLGEFLAQLRQEGYSIFILKGDLPECDADLVLQAVPAVQTTRPRLLADVQSSGSQSSRGQSQQASGASGGAYPSSGVSGGAYPASAAPAGTSTATRDEEADLEAAMMLSLAENVPGPEGGPASIDNNELQMALGRSQGGQQEMDDDAEMQMALALSQSQAQQEMAARQQQQPQESEEDELQRAISMSLAGGGASVTPTSTPQAPSQPSGWGARLAAQEAEEEELYLAEQARQKKEEEEELRKALEMSMQDDNKAEPPIVNVGGVLKHKKLPSPTGNRLDTSTTGGGPSKSKVGPSAPSSSSQQPKTTPAATSSATPITPKSNPAKSPSKVSNQTSSKPGPSSGASPSKPPLPAAAPAKPLPKSQPVPARPSLSAALAGDEEDREGQQGGATPQAHAPMPAVGGHTLGGERRPPTGDTDPAEIRRRRLAFLESMQKNKTNQQ